MNAEFVIMDLFSITTMNAEFVVMDLPTINVGENSVVDKTLKKNVMEKNTKFDAPHKNIQKIQF